MSDILARLRVRETHGIRRFLYPLSAVVTVDGLERLTRTETLTLATPEGTPVPLQISHLRSTLASPKLRLDFAVSLGPLSEMELLLRAGGTKAAVSDPLRLSHGPPGELESVQEKFAITLSDRGDISRVSYEGVPHLRAPSRVTRSGATATMVSGIASPAESPLSAQVDATGRYPDGCPTGVRAAITACKSWATVTHRLENARAQEVVHFDLPFAATFPRLIYDFGVGQGVYGKLQAAGPQEVVWHTVFGDAPYARWSVTADGREDYVGAAATAEEYRCQRWFHLVDGDKALAVAVTHVPPSCTDLIVALTAAGDVRVEFQLDGNRAPVAEFGVCYHFLNDIPPIAAATNPQSILLPPTVEVLPA